MKTKHTPGEWEPIIQKYPHEPKEIYTGVGVTERLIGGFYSTYICNSLLPDSDKDYIKQHENIKADMVLMAASKILLEALAGLYEAMKQEGYGDCNPAMKSARNAIKKATT